MNNENKLWILRPRDDGNGPWAPWYDKAFGFIVCAASEDEARQIAQANGGDETRSGEPAWTDSNLSTCEEMVAGERGVVMQDFRSA